MTFGRTLIGGVGFAALAAATPAAAQYYPYGNAYGYGRGISTQAAVDQCAAAVQNRSYGRVVSITSVDPDRNRIHVRGLASSGRMAYNPYGVGFFGMLGSNYRANMSFTCSVDYRGRVRDVDLYRR